MSCPKVNLKNGLKLNLTLSLHGNQLSLANRDSVAHQHNVAHIVLLVCNDSIRDRSHIT